MTTVATPVIGAGDTRSFAVSPAGAHLDADRVSAWFGANKVLERVSLSMPPGTVTALIGPSGCGKSTFLRILNRMHELVPVGEAGRRGSAQRRRTSTRPGTPVTMTRKRIGMVFQKPNPFPAMTIADNVVAGLKLTGTQGQSRRTAPR